MKALIIPAVVAGFSVGSAWAQDSSAGEATFKKWCQACHAAGGGAKNKVGPLLNGLDGRKSGTVEDFKYTDANKDSGITWNEAAFLEYIKDPRAKIPGTKMVFSGLKNEQEAKGLWGYLAQFAADGKKK